MLTQHLYLFCTSYAQGYAQYYCCDCRGKVLVLFELCLHLIVLLLVSSGCMMVDEYAYHIVLLMQNDLRVLLLGIVHSESYDIGMMIVGLCCGWLLI